MSPVHCQQLLDAAVPLPTAEQPNEIYAVCYPAAFIGRPTHPHGDGLTWHGYPIAGQEVPGSVYEIWIARNTLTRTDAQRLSKQTAVPEQCGCRG
jgi:hypothetical protein